MAAVAESPPAAAWGRERQDSRLSRARSPRLCMARTRHAPDPAMAKNRDEIRRHVGGRHRAHPQCGRPRRSARSSRPSGGRGRLRHGRRDQQAGRLDRELSAPARRTRVRRGRRSGEQVTAGLLAVGSSAIGVPARSWIGWQIPIQTSAMHGSARDLDDRARPDERRGWPKGRSPWSRGSRASRHDNRISTLGRGGSDTSAVALAAALEGRPLRHLHRCRRCLHDRPAHRFAGEAARAGRL